MTPDECIQVIHDWLRDMAPRDFDAVEEAVTELRIHVAGAGEPPARSLAPRIAQTAALAGSAHLLWGAVAGLGDCSGPAYSASGIPIDARGRSTVRL
jgi:hypothetical protein